MTYADAGLFCSTCGHPGIVHELRPTVRRGGAMRVRRECTRQTGPKPCPCELFVAEEVPVGRSDR